MYTHIVQIFILIKIIVMRNKIWNLFQNKKTKIDLSLDLSKVNRVEVIDEKGRSYVNWKDGNSVSCSIQDDGRTLKIFIKNDKK